MSGVSSRLRGSYRDTSSSGRFTPASGDAFTPRTTLFGTADTFTYRETTGVADGAGYQDLELKPAPRGRTIHRLLPILGTPSITDDGCTLTGSLRLTGQAR